LNKKIENENVLIRKFRDEKFVDESLKNERRRLKDEDLQQMREQQGRVQTRNKSITFKKKNDAEEAMRQTRFNEKLVQD